MIVGKLCNPNVAVIRKNERVLEAARRMRDEHVGDLVVVEERDGRRVPIGVLTDRDIVVGILAKDPGDLANLDAGDVITSEVVTARESDDIDEVLARMKHHAIRRVPVVDATGNLTGIFTLDDVLELLYREMSGVNAVITHQQDRERTSRP